MNTVRTVNVNFKSLTDTEPKYSVFSMLLLRPFTALVKRLRTYLIGKFGQRTQNQACLFFVYCFKILQMSNESEVTMDECFGNLFDFIT